jgi:hypothetical protein
MAGVYGYSSARLSWRNALRQVHGDEVTGTYFDLLGVRPEVGRFFHAADEHGPNSALCEDVAGIPGRCRHPTTPRAGCLLARHRKNAVRGHRERNRCAEDVARNACDWAALHVGGNLTEVMGVAEDGKYHDLQESPQPAVFLPLSQVEQNGTVFVVRSRRTPRKPGRTR